ncbi:hypothetical protein [Mucilaginibacter phyllosphaerae]|uniref:Sugar lactone lactonase YvrE n=1 Tax=Mucilaginibacter phyllosphaerae TaxID=1812349 RepID=A0A4Y8AF81_9SPHI|nr:hypothetical protein [Mucilaginibacter phyllosphaerae]MBB3968941.1 sugar lactone lactonase YvrE [Mucilaginibacter phyllosphaerae]TEW67436.1 hypothetical protein E2R65_05455 [Mucilaginibacter phyllosphaerae]GGH23419.1 hypothetical protein GCM10007352_37290 [Mucilaginibacter phyllosphaerae]
MKKTLTPLYLLLLTLVVTFSACTKNSNVANELPVLVTNNLVTEASGTSAYTGGIITNTAANFIEYGVCYSTANPAPTISDAKTQEKIRLLSFNSHLTGLTPNTTYYVRAYATNATGTGYGDVIQFKTGDGTTVYGTVSTFAGNGAGYVNGTGTAALFNHPTSVTADAAGNVYVSDAFNSVIRKITPDGITTTVAGNGTLGYTDGPAASAQFYAPAGLAVDAAGNIFVADMGNNLIRKISTAGVVSTVAGNGSAGYANGTGAAATFSSPAGIALDAQGDLIVADMSNNIIRRVTQAGVVTTIAGSRSAGYLNALGTSAAFNKPSSIAIDATGNMYVTEAANNAIRKIDNTSLVTTFAGGLDSIALAIGKPQAITIDAANNFFIADANSRILKISKDKVLTVFAGKSGTTGTADGDGSMALFNDPRGIVADKQGNIYVADYNNHRIRKLR